MEKREASIGSLTLAVSGMTCGGCVNSVRRALSRVPGVTGTTVDLESGRAVVEGTASPQALLAAIEAAGYGVALARGG